MLSRGVCRNFCLLHSSPPDGPLPASLPPRAGLPAAHKATGSPGLSAFLERGLVSCPSSASLGGSRSLDVSTSPASAVPSAPPSSRPPPVDSGPGLKCKRRPGWGTLLSGPAVPSVCTWERLAWIVGRPAPGGPCLLPKNCGGTAPPRPLPAGPAAINQEINNLLPPFLKPPLPFPVESPVCLGTSQSGPPRGGPR